MIITERLDLVPASAETIRAALDGANALSAALGAAVPPTWPPEFLDAPALEWVLARLLDAPETGAWWLYFVLLREEQGARTLIGSAGYKGPPSADGVVEIGYGIVADQRRRGYATEAAQALITRAFRFPEMHSVAVETFPELTGSLGVIRRSGFRRTGDGSEPRAIRFELTREEYAALRPFSERS